MQKFTHLLTCTILCLSISYLAVSQDENLPENPQQVYSRVRVTMSPVQFQRMLNSGIEFDHISNEDANHFMSELSASDIKKVISFGGKVKYLVKNVMTDYLEKNAADKKNENRSKIAAFPTGFTYGSMGSFLTFDQIVAKLDWMKTTYPNLITVKQSVGTSVQGRSIWMVKISDNPTLNENEPKVFYNALHHAREPMSMTQMIYFMCYALEKYGTDPEITNMINSRELFFVPCLNPDGYVYNQSIAANGGGMWRKNRKRNSSSSYGVDLNRNYSFKWGFDNAGSSPTTTSDTYRGLSAFSEPETKAVRDFIISKPFKLILSYHAYGNYLINPYSYSTAAANPDSMLFRLRGVQLNESGVLKAGTAIQTVNYSTNGDAGDWTYGEQITKPKIFGYTPEVGTVNDGFWPVQSRIEPLCLQMLRTNINLALMAGEYYRVKIPVNQIANTIAFDLANTVSNYGFSAATTEYITFQTTNTKVLSSDTVRFSGLIIGASVNKTLRINLSAMAGTGTVSGNLVIKYLDGSTATQPVTFNHNIIPTVTTSTSRLAGELTNLEEVDNNNITLYPNPSTDVVSIKVEDYQAPMVAQILNTVGQKFSDFTIENKQAQVGVSHLKQGTYLMKIETDKGFKIVKFTKQ